MLRGTLRRPPAMPDPQGAPPRLFLLNLQLLRFVAATMVVLLHGANVYQAMGGEWRVLTAVRHVGGAGVDVFFVLSGFIIWTTNRGTGAAGAPRYLYRRLARIFLGYWPFFLLALGVRLAWAPGRLEGVDYLTSFFLWPQLQAGQMLHVSWTLSYELYFYGLFSLLLFVPRRLTVLAVATALVVAVNVHDHVVLNAFEPGGYRALGVLRRFATAPVLLQFFAGCFLAHVVERGWRRYGLTSLVGGTLVIAACALAGARELEVLPFQSVTLYGLGAVAVVYGLVVLEQEGWRPLPRLANLGGGASYTIYLCHTIFYQLARDVGLLERVRSSPVPAELAYLALVLGILAFSIVFSLLVEGPLYRLAKGLWPGTTRRATATPP